LESGEQRWFNVRQLEALEDEVVESAEVFAVPYGLPPEYALEDPEGCSD
jgi:hypothetical protein